MEAARDEARVEKDKSEEELLNQALQLVEQMKNCFGEQAPGLLEIPSDFRCPLSQELMSDPVIVASGQTYERTYIQHWISEGYTRCPKTGQVLSHKNLIPNYTVKALIANWCEANNVPLPGPVTLNPSLSTLHPLSPATPTKAESDSEQVSSPPGYMLDNFRSSGTLLASGRTGVRSRRTKFGTLRGSGELERVRNGSLGGDEGEPSQAGRSPSRGFSGELEGRNSPLRAESTAADCTFQHARSGSNCSVASSVEDGLISPAIQGRDATQAANERYGYSGDLSGDINRINLSGSGSGLFNEEPGSPARRPEKSVFRRRGEERDISLPRIIADTSGTDSNAQSDVDRWVEDLQSSDIDVQRQAAAELRLLAKHNMENRITIANSGAIKPLVALLKSSDPKTQENAVTALLNLSINDNNKAEIAHAGAIGPLVNVLRVGNSEAMENAAATLFSLSVMDDNKITIGASGAISPLVHLLINGTPRGKKDAATALFNLSIYHENKGRIVQAGAIKPLVELMAEPAAGMVDKAVAVLANLATISEGRQAIGDEHGIPALVEVVEAGSQRGKENAAAALLQLCTNNNKHRALVLQEGAIPPLVALSQSGTARAKEKARLLYLNSISIISLTNLNIREKLAFIMPPLCI